MFRFRIHYSKQGDLRMISHRDLLRTLERLFRRAGLNLAMTQGFHPRPKMSFPSALGVGLAATGEIMELALAQPYDAAEVLEALRRHAVPGLDFHRVELLNSGERKGQVESATYTVTVPAERRAAAAAAIERFLALDQHWVQREKRPAPVDIRAGVERLELRGPTLRMTLRVERSASARPRDVLEAIGLDGLEADGAVVTRTHLQLADQS